MLKKAKVLFYLSDRSSFNQTFFIENIKKSNAKFLSNDEEKIAHFVSYLPPGTIFAQSYGIEEKNDIVCLPLMSSHMSLPLKQGEFVWYISDDDSKKDRVNSQEIFKNHPLLAINDYWISRIHGTLISEDLNYSFKERDSLVLDKKITKNELDKENKDSAILPSFDSKNIFISNEEDYNIKSTKDLYEQGLGNYFGDKAVPRKFSKSDDFTLQGSYNTLINFTSSDSSYSQKDSREGLIDIVAGRLALQDFTVENDEKIKFKKLITNSTNIENKKKEEVIELSPFKFIEIENTSGGEELFKKPNLYLNEDFDTFNLVEDKTDYDADASRILISESEDIDNDLFYDIDFLSSTRICLSNIEKTKVDINKSYLTNKISLNNIETEEIDVFSINNNDEITAVPTIFLKSNNIRIVSRKDLKNKTTSIPSGNIRIVNENENFLNYSQILLENKGDIFIDGHIIKIGDFRKEFMKINNISSLEEIELNDSNLKNMHGKGFGVLLGYNEKTSESLVLGESLVAILSEIIEKLNSSLEKIGKHSQEIEQSINVDNQKIATWATSIGSALGIPFPAPLKFYNPTKLNQDLSLKEITDLKNIKDNLTDILSRFSKTS